MARTPLTVGKWLRIVWLALFAAALVAVIVGTAYVMVSSRQVTPSAVTLVLGASAALYVVVESLGVSPRHPPPLKPPTATALDAVRARRQKKSPASPRL